MAWSTSGAVIAGTKFLTWLASPMVLGVLAWLLAWRSARRGERRRSRVLLAGALLWTLVWSSPLFYAWFGYTLERDYPPVPVAEIAPADAIVLLGGGMSPPAGPVRYPELSAAADRVWHAARLYQAGKAPVIIPSGNLESRSSAVLLRDLGVPAAAIRVEDASRNTAENALLSKQVLDELGARRVILVTSAFHMRRAQMLYERLGLEVVPAATDHEATHLRARNRTSGVRYKLLPDPESLARNTYILKEYIGYWVYRLRGDRGSAHPPAGPGGERLRDGQPESAPVSGPAAGT